MKKLLPFVLKTVLSGTVFSQQKATFKGLVHSVAPYETNISQIKEKFSDVAMDIAR